MSAEVEGQAPGHQQPPYNHSTGQRSASGEVRECHHREIPGIINNNNNHKTTHLAVSAQRSKYKKITKWLITNQYQTTSALSLAAWILYSKTHKVK